jgi:hypothetical protein
MPSFLSQSATCCIAGTKVGRRRVLGHRNKECTTDRNGTPRKKSAGPDAARR